MTFMTSCEGPAGANGQDANATCTQCHNNQSLVLAKILQAENSVHQTGATFERNTADCALCHTSQGFIEVLNTGATTTAADVKDPLPVGCITCHDIHDKYDTTDFALRTTDPVVLQSNGATVDLGNSNICANCHQPRPADPMPAVGGGDVTLTSNRWGPHHGTQSAIVAGTAAYQVAGTEAYPTSNPHTVAGCTTCHMSDPYGAFAGGHSLNLTYDNHGKEADYVVGCTKCHPTATDFDINDTQTEVAALIDSLKTKLVSANILVASSGLVNASSSKPLVISANKAGALFNYYMVTEDRSTGVHNPGYVKALLKNSIEALN
jgi:hypothetical protein